MDREDSAQFQDGWFAHKASVPVDDNPFSERSQPKSYDLWQSGWCERFNAVKHDGDLSLDDNFYW